MTEPLRLHSIAGLLQRLQLRIAMAALLIMMCVTTCDVVLRYIFGHPIHGAYDIVEVLLVVFVFHGMATTFFTRQNIVIDLIDQVVSPRTSAALTRAADLVTIVLLVVVGWAMAYPAMQAFDYGDRKLELGLPIYIVWIAALLGLAGTIVCAAGAMIWARRAPSAHP